MKLHEFTIPMDDGGPFDDMQSRDQEDAMPSFKDIASMHTEKIPTRTKAKKFRDKFRYLKRERSQIQDKEPKDAEKIE